MTTLEYEEIIKKMPLVKKEIFTIAGIRKVNYVLFILILIFLCLFVLENPKQPDTVTLLLLFSSILSSSTILYNISKRDLKITKFNAFHVSINLVIITLIIFVLVIIKVTFELFIITCIMELGLFILNTACIYLFITNKRFPLPFSYSSELDIIQRRKNNS